MTIGSYETVRFEKDYGIKQLLDDKSYKPTFGAYNQATALMDSSAAAAAAE